MFNFRKTEFNKKSKMRLLRIISFALFCICLVAPLTASAAPSMENAYGTYSMGPGYIAINTQAAYNASEMVKLDVSDSRDFFVYGDKLFFTDVYSVKNAENDIYDDTLGLNLKVGRIVVTDIEGNTLKIIDNTLLGGYFLSEPAGIFIKDDIIFVADKAKQQIVKLDYSAADIFAAEEVPAISTLSKPDNPLYGKKLPFVPTKLVVDAAHNIIATCEGNPNGAVHMSENGEFVGYVGINKTPVSFKAMLQSIFFSKEQKNRLLKKVPSSPSGLAINSDGLIYTITNGTSDGAIKLLDTTGTKVYATGYGDFNDTVALDTDSEGMVYSVGSGKFISIYDSFGYFVFSFGNKQNAERLGSLSDPVAIKVLENKQIIVLDKTYNAFILFNPTEFFLDVAKALSLYRQGYYLEAEPIWDGILELNGDFILSYNALAQANFKKGNYKLALDQFEMAENHGGYSEAFWYIRNEWIQNNAVWMLIIALTLVAVTIAVKQVNKRTTVFAPVSNGIAKIKSNKIISQLNYSFYYIRHPKKAIEQMKYKQKLTVLPAAILYFIYFALIFASKFLNGFLFRTQAAFTIDVWRTVFMILLPILLGVVSNYFVSSVTDGEGKFRHVYIAAIYSMVPYILYAGIRIILTNILTYNEEIILQILDILVYAYCAVLIVISIARVHFFGFKKTAKNIFVTVFTFAMAILFALIIYLLGAQLWDFLSAFFEELIR